ncbi:MAG: hypothetical protein ACTTJE_05015 [Schwartzia sp. (in: firmicutes)]
MNEREWAFDLQLFAEEAEGAPSAGGAGDAGGAAGGEGAGQNAAQSAAKGGLGGDNATILGGKDAGQTAGVPEAYDFKSAVPEGMTYDEEAATAFSGVARDCGLSQEQAAKVAAYGMQYLGAQAAAFEAQVAATIQGWGEEAKKELGTAFTETTHKAAIGIEAMEKTIPNLRAALNETGAGNRIEIIRALAMAGELLGEDKNRLTGSGADTMKNIYPNTDFSAYVS